MDSEIIWRRLVRAAAEPSVIGTDDVRRELLSEAMTLGSTITADSVGCSVTETLTGGFQTPVASSSLALELDHAQYRDDDGPCVAACRDGRVHSITVMADERSYRGFTHTALSWNVSSSLSVPLAGLARASALNLYARSASAFDPPQARAVAMLLARCTAAVLAADPFADSSSSQRTEGPSSANTQAVPSLSLRHREQADLVAEAVRVLAAREHTDQAQAFLELARRSRDDKRSLFAICRDLVQGNAGEAT